MSKKEIKRFHQLAHAELHTAINRFFRLRRLAEIKAPEMILQTEKENLLCGTPLLLKILGAAL